MALTFPARFNGPPGTANGGYASGVLAQLAPSETVEVTLRRPPPLEVPLRTESADDRYTLTDQEGRTVAVAEPAANDFDDLEPVVVGFDFDEPPIFAGRGHPFRTCFTCGPDRAPGDGLRIFTQRVPGRDVLADHWTPDGSLTGDDGLVRPEFVWAALDCPSGWAAFDRLPQGGVAVLGRMTAAVYRQPIANEFCQVVGWARERDGRKIKAGAALYAADGELMAAARAVWISL
ncbi:MAG: hypothetical protein JWN03_1543 [Nocardia sp.]|uniref:hypothetical protein n=1 Tax=Nocardia sp. TaxID=1821 RepID=UPI002633496A|nr:hypothetical protein [Nocardia sp.]MCU1641268.1 hypothetical protein [Nocardia sp.]